MPMLSRAAVLQPPRIPNPLRLWRQARTASIILPAIAVFLTHGFLIRLAVRDPKRRQRLLIKNVSRYSRFGLKRMRLGVATKGTVSPDENFLIVSNHLSYIDMMVIASAVPAVFVTSIDMGEVFFLGTMAEIGGSLFIERRHRERVGHDLEQIASRLREGFHVVLFPEGTSSNGDGVLPFKKSLLMSAVAAERSILPLTLRYTEVDGRPFSPENRDRVCWYDKMKFGPHLFGIFGSRSVQAELIFHSPIRPREADTRDTLAKWTHRVVSGGYKNRNLTEGDEELAYDLS